jgi:hypothetical protein
MEVSYGNIVNELKNNIYFISSKNPYIAGEHHSSYKKEFRVYDARDVFQVQVKYWNHIYRVSMPFDNPDLKILVKEKTDKLVIYVNNIIVDRTYMINDINNFKDLMDQGGDTYSAMIYVFMSKYITHKIEYVKCVLDHNPPHLNNIFLNACIFTNADIVAALIEKGANPTYKNCEAYKLAYRNKRMDIVALLKKYDAKPELLNIKFIHNKQKRSCIIM